MSKQPPILVTGAHRSGTTWVGRTLTADPGIAYIGELFNVDRPRPGVCAARFPHWFMRLDSRSGGAFRAQLTRALDFRFDYADASVACLRSPAGTRRAAADAVRCARARIQHQRPLVKDPIALLSAEWLADTFNMDVVVMIRHPAAFAASLMRLGWGFDFREFTAQPALMEGDLAPIAGEIERFADAPPAILEQAALLWKALYLVVLRYRAQRPHWTMLRHEDICKSPTEGFSRLCETLSIADPGAVLVSAERTSQSDNPADAPAGVAHALNRNSRLTAVSWKKSLTVEQTRTVRDVVSDVSRHFYDERDWE